MPNRYWIGNGSNTAWTTNSNWSTTSGGVADTVAPTSADDVFFNAGGSGNCVISSNINVNTFDMDTILYTGTLTDGGYTIDVDHNLAIVGSPDAIDRTNSTGTWRVNKSGWCAVARLSAYLRKVIIGSGAIISNAPVQSRAASYGHWLFTQKLVMESGSSLATCVLCPINGYEADTLDIHPNATIAASTEIRFYYPTGVYQKGFTTFGGIQFNYGTGYTLVQTGDIKCASLLVHRSGGSGAFSALNKWYCNGYKLNVDGSLRLGLSSVGIGQYAGCIFCGSGTVAVGGTLGTTLTLGSGYLQPETATIYVGTNLDLRQVQVTNSGVSTIIMSGGNLQYIFVDSPTRGYPNEVGNLRIQKTNNIVEISGIPTCNNFELNQGNLSLRGTTVNVSGDLSTTGGRFWNGTNYNMSSGLFVVNGNTYLNGSYSTMLNIHNLRLAFNSPSSGIATYCNVTTSSYSGNRFMDATHYTNGGYSGSNPGWKFGDRYLKVSTPVGYIILKNYHGGE